MRPTPAAELLQGTVLVTVPHFDDEALGCGGLLAAAPDPARVFVLYVTNGRGAETMLMPGVRVDPALDMGALRREESLQGLERLGLRRAHARFLDVPEMTVARHRAEVAAGLAAALRELKPDTVLTPFRYDRHEDHVALNRVARELLPGAAPQAALLEYFVYYRWKLLPRKDVRPYCRPEHAAAFDLAATGAAKKAALLCHTSQVTRFHSWQTRAVLSAELIAEVSAGLEWYVRPPPGAGDRDLFTLPPAVLHAVHGLEPWLKRRKDQAVFLLRRALRRG
jgi:LmbE family N-acetylglucosaminyl deacetylase